MQSSRFSKLARVMVLLLAMILVGSTALANRRPTASLTSSGKVMVNGAQVQPNATLVSGSQVATMDGSSAVISFGPLGQVFLGANSSIMVNFDDAGVKVELKGGSVRVQKANPTNVEVFTETCNNVEVMNGKVEVVSQDKKVANKKTADAVLETGQSKDWQTKGKAASRGASTDLDYKVSLIECDLAGAAQTASRVPMGVIVAGAAGGAAAIITPIVRSSGNNSVSLSRP
jgi:ferric-dicitrate binding protein FerR (iron transport regulator)